MSIVSRLSICTRIRPRSPLPLSSLSLSLVSQVARLVHDSLTAPGGVTTTHPQEVSGWCIQAAENQVRGGFKKNNHPKVSSSAQQRRQSKTTVGACPFQAKPFLHRCILFQSKASSSDLLSLSLLLLSPFAISCRNTLAGACPVVMVSAVVAVNSSTASDFSKISLLSRIKRPVVSYA